MSEVYLYTYKDPESIEYWDVAHSKEEALSEGEYWARDYGLEEFWISKGEHHEIPNVYISDEIIEQLDEGYGEKIPNHDGYFIETNSKQDDDLNLKINAVVKKWIIENKLEPDWYSTTVIERIEVSEQKEKGPADE